MALQSSALSQTQLALSAVAGRAQLRPAVGRRAGLHHLRDVFLPLLRELLFGHGERVIHAEVIDDDGHGHGYGQHAGEGTERTDQHPRPRLRVHVSVAQSGHGDHGPPEADGDVLEHGVVAGCWVVGAGSDPLGVVDHGGEDEDAQREEDNEQQELVSARSEGVSQYTQADEVPRQLEDPQDAHEADHAQKAQDVFGGFGGESAQAHLQVKGQNGHEVYDVQDALDELQLVRAEGHAHQELEGEPQHADALHVGERRVRLDLVLLAEVREGVVAGRVRLVDDRVEGLVRLQAEGCDGDQDEEQGGKCNELKRSREREMGQ